MPVIRSKSFKGAHTNEVGTVPTNISPLLPKPHLGIPNLDEDLELFKSRHGKPRIFVAFPNLQVATVPIARTQDVGFRRLVAFILVTSAT